MRALGLIYQIHPDPRFVAQMVRFCDAQLAERNDLAPAPTGQYMIWTDRIDPAWPNDLSKPKLSTGGEQGVRHHRSPDLRSPTWFQELTRVIVSDSRGRM